MGRGTDWKGCTLGKKDKKAVAELTFCLAALECSWGSCSLGEGGAVPYTVVPMDLWFQ